jgi:hypothetical protein
MANFQTKGRKFDGAYCTVDTFRHLLFEKQAEQHLINVSRVLKKNGIYILGLHLLPGKEVTNKVIRWTAKRGRLTVKSSMAMLGLDKKKRTETLKVILRIKTSGVRFKSGSKQEYESIYQLRTYTLKQFNRLLSNTNVFEIINVYDHYYDLSRPAILNEMTDYGVFVLRKI